MKWCCSAFHGNYEVAAERGFGILIDRDSDLRPRFILQYRAVNQGKENQVHSETAVSLISETQIHFCPWCGTNLQEFYGAYVDVLARPRLKI
jgi:hypothetical protein